MENERVKWFRVIDPLSPLYGCDVRGTESENVYGRTLLLQALRRIDIFVGDRPYQLVAGPGKHLGVSVQSDSFVWDGTLEPSPIQDDVMEISTSQPYGPFQSERQIDRGDGCVLHVVRYENAVQIAFEDETGRLVKTRTFLGDDRRIDAATAIGAFDEGADAGGMKLLLEAF